MNQKKPTTRTEADKPAETTHLDEGQKAALDLSGEVEHSQGARREKLTTEATHLGESPKQRKTR